MTTFYFFEGGINILEEIILKDLEKDGLITKVELKKAIEILNNKMQNAKIA
ncbi:hypothetical protein [Clostridium tagluense]|uniref:hypothetical protein n=1 Tax=Clostridium tagluense TaxID=360422 RepID=UPI001C6EF59E|nr:hypothetical protein [Clostridium tagluense]MBW9156288.1 hypothetical protein [Clostridium tagluense]WLC64296.1 hypothetical protein KTC93_15650 [Clostridium tagluense]